MLNRTPPPNFQDDPYVSVHRSGASVDPVQVLMRWKWLILFGAMLGLGGGYMYWVKLPKEYKSYAVVQVQTPFSSDTIPLEVIDAMKLQNSNDELMVIRSSRVLSLAVGRGDFGRFPELAGKSDQQIVYWLQSPNRLVVEPASEDAASSIIRISFACNNPELASDAVRFIVEGYNEFLGSEHKNIGAELMSTVTKARDEIDDKYANLGKEYQAFRENSPLMWIGDEGRDPYSDNLDKAVKEMGTLELEMKKLAGTIQAAEEGLKQERQPEALILMLRSEAGIDINSEQQAQGSLVTAEGRADNIRESKLIPLQIKEKQLVEAGLGENHPTLMALRQEIKLYEVLISRASEAENQQRKQLEEEINSKAPSIITPIQRVATMIQGLKERVGSLQLQYQELAKFRQENEEKSKQLQTAMAKNKLFLDQMESTKSLLAGVTSALDRFSIAPESGQRSMKELDRIEAFANGPYMQKYLGLGAFAGGATFALLGFLISLADRRFRNADEIVMELNSPIWGQVPMMDFQDPRYKAAKEHKWDKALMAHHFPKSAVAESFRGVRTSLYFGNRSGDLKVIQITSSSPGDGKSTLAANMAISIAQSGRKVLLIDCDFRRPRVGKIFGISGIPGLSDLVQGKVELDEVIQGTDVPGLYLIPSGNKVSNPSELLVSESYANVMAMLREKYDYVIVDTPPILAVSDATNIAARVDGVIFAVRLRSNDRYLSIRSVRALRAVNANLLGTVLIGVSGSNAYGYGYGYGYGAGYGYSYGYGNDRDPSGAGGYYDETDEVVTTAPKKRSPQ